MSGSPLEKDSPTRKLNWLNDRGVHVRTLMEQATVEEIGDLWKQIDISAIYHDCALEGQVISPDELESAFDPRAITDAANLALYTSLRSHRSAFDLMRQLAASPDLVFSMSLFKEFHVLFATKSEEANAADFRREIPLHRSYFQEINEPTIIKANMRKLISWLNDPHETDKLHPVVFASRFHAQFMNIFPFRNTSGKVGRIVMNLILTRNGCLPAVIHATERQRYYEALRQPEEPALTDLVIESVMASFDAAVRFFRRN